MPTRNLASRRQFLAASIAGGVWLAGRWSPVLGQDAPDKALPAGKKLIVRTPAPLNAEPELAHLVREWITPVESFYVRNHAKVPAIDLDSYRVTVDGLVGKPLKLSLAELGQLPAVKLTATLTCAGNRRSEFTGPKIPGVAWGAAAIGNAEWSGVPLSAVLKRAELKPEAKHVWFEGLDQIVDKNETFPFGGSIPLEKALSEQGEIAGAILATHMNGKPLTAEHGAPLRTIVPGFIGARSVKWLTKITVSDRPSPNHYVADAYKVIAEDSRAALDAAQPLYEYALNSVICLPAPKSKSAGKIAVKGFALPSGAAGRMLKSIELSTDGGKTWSAAKIDSKTAAYCWALWSAEINLPQGAESLLVRATDSSGETQPREMPWNVKGYQFNAWHRVPLA